MYPQAKHDVVLGAENLVGKNSGKSFLIVGQPVLSHLRKEFGPLHFTET